MFRSSDAWLAYDGDAVLDGTADSEGALAAVEKRLSGSYDNSDEYSQEDDSDGYDDSDEEE